MASSDAPSKVARASPDSDDTFSFRISRGCHSPLTNCNSYTIKTLPSAMTAVGACETHTSTLGSNLKGNCALTCTAPRLSIVRINRSLTCMGDLIVSDNASSLSTGGRTPSPQRWASVECRWRCWSATLVQKLVPRRSESCQSAPKRLIRLASPAGIEPATHSLEG